ncbi:surfeit locus protein 1 isoform X3 [Lingula anatina]|uniref:SURF1-like protein n=1 Tax=Lingula anatina TaxID=7574 RepID=A0A1S3K3W6_LINAN|nr:surfeit locus protein 1 isoform X3 [Lingula anatina]|eukprot:XP_013417320.1 surfeit locus protein 1 isoform X3 [Lingula anatina]
MIGIRRQFLRFTTSLNEQKGQHAFVAVLQCFGRRGFSTTVKRNRRSSIPKGIGVRDKELPYWKRFLKGGYPLLLAPAIFTYLGFWQIQRLKWKMGIIDMLNERTNSDPIPLPEDLREIQDLEYHPIRVRGTFDHSREVVVSPKGRVESKNQAVMRGLQPNTEKNEMTHYGGWVVTPFKLSDRNTTILINRGWVPHSKIDPKKRQKGQVEGEVELVGLVKHAEKKSRYASSNMYTKTVKSDYEAVRFLVLDVDEIAHYLNTAPVCLSADADSTVEEGPVGGQTRVKVRNDHFSYILIWLSLAILTSYSWYKQFRVEPSSTALGAYIKRSQRAATLSSRLGEKQGMAKKPQ